MGFSRIKASPMGGDGPNIHCDIRSPKEELLVQKGVWITKQGYCFVGRTSSRSIAGVRILLAHPRPAVLVWLLCLGSNS